MGFSRQEHCSGLPRPPPGDLPDSGTELTSLALQMGLLLSHWGKPPSTTSDDIAESYEGDKSIQQLDDAKSFISRNKR